MLFVLLFGSGLGPGLLYSLFFRFMIKPLRREDAFFRFFFLSDTGVVTVRFLDLLERCGAGG